MAESSPDPTEPQTSEDTGTHSAEQKEETDFSQAVLRKVHSLRCHRKLCDVVLRAGGREIPTHRAVLSACSSYFLAMFTHELLESGQEVVEIKDMDPDILSSLVDFAYTGLITVTVENVQEVLSAASLLQISQVQNLCCEFLKKQLDASNCLGIKCFAEANGCPQLSDIINTFARQHFQEVALGSEFLNNTWENVAALISSNNLNVKKEENVYMSVLQWVKQSPSERTEHLPNLLNYVRLPMLSVSFLVQQVAEEPLIRGNMQCRDLVDEAMKYHLLPEEHDIRSTNCRYVPRKSTVGTLYAVGGKESSESITRSVESYNFLEDKWSDATGMIVRRQQLGVGVLEGKVYAVGGSDGSLRLSSVECFDATTNFWSFVAPMSTCRSGVGVGVLGGAMYAAGGYDGRSCLNTVERFDLEKNLWSPVAQMSTRRSFPGVAVFNGKLYIFGGNDGTSFLNVVECYDPHINRWCTLTPLHKPRAGIGVTILGQQIFVAGGNDGTSRLDSFDFLDVRSGKWHAAAHMTSSRDGVCLCTLGNSLVAVGGINGPSYLKSSEIYDPVNNTWEMVASMETCRAAAGVAVVS
jgi:hypothetical protein